LVLWVWEHPEDLSFISPRVTGVAFLAETIDISNGILTYRPRLQPLRMPPGTPVLAVVRIETSGSRKPPVSAVADAIVRGSQWPGTLGLQIDFDAKASERAFYRDVLRDLHSRLPKTVPLEITALVSWCTSDRWIHSLPVVAAVPMYFRMGADPHLTSERLIEPLCSGSIGISTDEFYLRVPNGKRVFVFHPRSWTEVDYQAVLRKSAQWN
jgi:hypothetical protein